MCKKATLYAWPFLYVYVCRIIDISWEISAALSTYREDIRVIPYTFEFSPIIAHIPVRGVQRHHGDRASKYD